MLPEDLTGRKYGKLTPIKYVGKSRWLCVCDCGNQKETRARRLKDGLCKSCGCLNTERMKSTRIAETHGMSKTKLYAVWTHMRARCYYSKDKRYKHYGGRGIIVCDEWKEHFEPFRDWALSNGYSETLTVDRIDVDGNYCPENCRFVTRAENNRNRRNNKKKG